MQKPLGRFDLCYNMTAKRKRSVIPSVTFHFGGANYFKMEPVSVDQSFGATTRCLSMLKIDEAGPTILGAFQQTNHRFVFDGARSMMAFASENCIKMIICDQLYLYLYAGFW